MLISRRFTQVRTRRNAVLPPAFAGHREHDLCERPNSRRLCDAQHARYAACWLESGPAGGKM